MRPELVRATLAGAKTQTRRLVTPGTSTVRGCWPSARAVWSRLDFAGATAAVARPPDGSPDTPVLVVPFVPGDEHEGDVVTVWPRVRPGDRLWVREAWRVATGHEGRLDAMSPAEITAEYEPESPVGLPVNYQADGAWRDAIRGFEPEPGRWRIGIHLPRWACRLELPVESVRGERVQAISEDDARAEGVEDVALHGYRWSFAATWDAINGKRPGASWAADPWVWVYQWPARKDQ